MPKDDWKTARDKDLGSDIVAKKIASTAAAKDAPRASDSPEEAGRAFLEICLPYVEIKRGNAATYMSIAHGNAELQQKLAETFPQKFGPGGWLMDPVINPQGTFAVALKSELWATKLRCTLRKNSPDITFAPAELDKAVREYKATLTPELEQHFQAQKGIK